jgi:hypothetical protein
MLVVLGDLANAMQTSVRLQCSTYRVGLCQRGARLVTHQIVHAFQNTVQNLLEVVCTISKSILDGCS